MKKYYLIIGVLLLIFNISEAQSLSFQTYMNPVIPGDHPDCTLTKIGNDFYTAGSSFNPTPVIYHSTDLVHWEAVAQPVAADWSNYGDAPAGGCWGGQVVYHGNKYWYYFSRSNTMYFTTADSIKGEWSLPTQMSTPSPVPGLGYDNSIFIDDDNSWYLLSKNGQVNNWIVQLGDNGQAQGAVLDLRWLNPAPSYPYSYAEGPVMWKYKGKYYYSFARNVAGGQKVMVSDSLTDNQSSWTVPVDLFNSSDPQLNTAVFTNPNHSSAAVMIDDSTSWVVHPLWRSGGNKEWYGQGRQGLLNQVRYDSNGNPKVDYPINLPKDAPKLPSSGIPWMVPHSDFFDSNKLNPEWSFLGYTPKVSYSLSERPGWFMLSLKNGKANTIIKNDAEHNYSLMTRVDFDPASSSDQAGIQIFNGNQTTYAKLYSSVDNLGKRTVVFSYKTSSYQVESPSDSASIVWLKIIRENHVLTGYCSSNGFDWLQVGLSFTVRDMENEQTNYNSWTGNRQGLYVAGSKTNLKAYFDLYIYRDAYTPILAECPANQNGTEVLLNTLPPNSLNKINNNDWTLYAGVEFGNSTYAKIGSSFKITASAQGTGGKVEVYIDSINANSKIAECEITTTGSWTSFQTFSADLLKPVTGNHDVYLKFVGDGSSELFRMQYFQFGTNSVPTDVKNSQSKNLPQNFYLYQNYPNPFNPSTTISFYIPMVDAPSPSAAEASAVEAHVTLKVYDVLGREIETLVNEEKAPGNYEIRFDGGNLTSGIYFYQLKAGSFISTRKFVLLK